MRTGNCVCKTVVVDASSYTLPYDYSLCNALVRQGCQVTLACSEFLYGTWEQPHDFSLWKPFYALTHAYAARHRCRTSVVWKAAKAAEHVLSMERVAAELRQSPPDVIHFQWLPLPLLDSVYLTRLAAIAPLVLTLHNTTVFHGMEDKRLLGIGLRSAFRRFDVIIVHTEYSRRRAVDLGWAAPEQLQVIPHGVLDCYAVAPEAQQNRPATEQQVLFFGNLKPYKGVDLLLRALALLPPGVLQNTRLVIAGKAMMDISPLRRLAADLKLDGRVQWKIGHVDDRDVSELFRSASIVALPYREIDQSGVLMTAIAFHKPLVATRVGGLPETIQHGIHGLLVEPGDVDGLATSLEMILSDQQRQSSMQAALRELCRGPLSWDHIADTTLKLYKQLTRRHAVAEAA